MESVKLPSTVEGIMAKPVITIEASDSVHDTAKLMSKNDVGSIVITQRKKPVGIVTERDIVKRVVAKGVDASKVPIKKVMSKSLTTIQSHMAIVDAIRIMQKQKIRRLLITKNEKLVGIVTQRDLLRALAFHVVISFRPLLETE